MSKKPSETTIKTSIRIRPCSEREKETYPGPNLVQAAHGEVRLYGKQAANLLNTNSAGGKARETVAGNKQRPGTPNRPATPTHGASAAAQAAWQAVQHQQALGADYQSYPFANVFGPETQTADVYNGSGCREIVESVLGGCNGTIFVYGQTGAGKTYTMDAFTKLVLQQLYTAAARDDSNCEVTITISAVELYNEILRCLLSGRENLQLRMGAGGPSSGAAAGVLLEGAEERVCHTCDEAAAVVEAAKANRAVGETRANARSSRSHVILRIKVEILQLNSSLGGAEIVEHKAGASAAPASVSFSLLNLVDLAGSERIDKSGSSDTPLRLREALNINKSLLCLGNVVTALAERSEGRKNTHIPYRDSKLTRLLEDSLGGNAMTALLACITPLPDWHMEQTRATLEFAARAARVVCSPQRNVLKLLPNQLGADSSALIAALQAEVAQLKELLALHKDGSSSEGAATEAAAGPVGQSRVQTLGKTLQSRPWDSCSSSSSDMADAAAADAAVSGSSASGEDSSRRRRMSSGNGSWGSRLRLSISGGRPAASGTGDADSAAAAAAAAAGSNSHSAGRQQGSGSSPPRTSSSNGLLWKFFQVRPPTMDSNRLQNGPEGLHSGLSPAGVHSGNHSSLKSAGLLMLASANHSPPGRAGGGSDKESSAGGSSPTQQQQSGMHPGMLTRWATFHNGRIIRPGSDGGWQVRGNSANSYALLSHEQQQQQQGAHPSDSDSSAGSSHMQQGGQMAAAGAAAMALRDHIIKQLVTALQQKKAEVKLLKEQQLQLQQQLEQAQQEGAGSKQKLRELAEGIQALASAREEEFGRWKGHLEELEVALQAAQQESLTYRQEALALVHQLTQLQARYRSLQSDQLRRSTIIQSANQNMLLQTYQSDAVQTAYGAAAAAVQQSTQLSNCVTSLLGIEECLRQLLTQSTAPKTITGAVGGPPSPTGRASSTNIPESPGPLPSPKAVQHKDVNSHVIHTESVRFDMNSGLITKQQSPKAAVQLESVLQQLHGLIPLVKAAAAAAVAAGITSTKTASGQLQTKGPGLLDDGSSNSSSNGSSPRISAAPSQVVEVRPETPAKCHKCDSIKPLLAIMQKLKDEVVNLRAAVKARDEQLAAAAATSATMKQDLEESRQQVGSLQERIDELAEELEVARIAAAAAATEAAEAKAAAAAAAAISSDSAQSATTNSSAGSGAAREVVSHDLVKLGVSEAGSLGAALSRQGSGAERVPLMSDDTPLPALHAQILMSWHALAMPRCFRTGFVLGHSTAEAAPWLDRQQCQAHIALLACLHQLQEDNPAAAKVQQQLLQQEEQLMEVGLSKLNRREFVALCQQWTLPTSGDAASKRITLIQQLWQPCGAAAAAQLAAASAAACQACLGNAPAMELAALMLKCNAAVMAATSNALADAAS